VFDVIADARKLRFFLVTGFLLSGMGVVFDAVVSHKVAAIIDVGAGRACI
jgi:hypothetical protein